MQGTDLKLPWAGGLIGGQFSSIDLNFDGVKDLFVFDRSGNRISTYINQGTTGQSSYVYAPEYASKFPELFNWALLVDYNNDGKEDIFTFVQGGCRVFKNTSSSGNGISFQLVTLTPGYL